MNNTLLNCIDALKREEKSAFFESLSDTARYNFYAALFHLASLSFLLSMDLKRVNSYDK